MPQLAFAQTFPPQDGVVADDTGRLNASEINSASADLKALGVKPLVLLVQSPQGYSGSLDLAYAAADNYGLGQGNRQVDANLLALVVVLSTRQSTVLYGDALKPVMEGGSGGGLAEQIRTNHLNTNLAAGKYTQAFAESLKFAAQQIDLARNPLPTATPQPSIIQNVDTSGLGNSLLICVVIGIVLGALAIFAPMLWRNRQRANAAALRRRSLQEQLLQARNVSADMITNLDFPVDPNEQIQFRFLALALEKERPEQLAPIATQYRQVYDRVAGALSTYNQLNESQPASEEEMTAAIGQYQQVQSEIKYASGFIDWLGQQSRNLEAEIASAPGEVDAAKKALAAATEQISRLAAAAPELKLPGAEQLLRPALTGIGQAERALQAEPPRSLTARADAIAARTGVGNLGASIKSLSDLYSTIAEQRRKIAAMEAQGYKLTQSRDLLDHGLSLLTGAAQAITERGEAFAATLQKARTALEQASTLASQAASLRAANEAALARLSAAGEDLKGLIKQGAEAFDAVDEYAEESWRDIRGNGTEAQRAADEAYTLWQEASKLNALTPDSEQDFTGASGLIVQANECVQTARQLIQAIIERLAHIRESQAAAKDEIAAAQRDVQGGLQFVAQFDRDISSKRDEDLQRASGHLEKARAEMAQSKPDWIAVVKLAREANDLADQALRDARTEHEQMEARRLKVKTTSQQAAAALSRAANFAAAHKIDILAPIFASIKEVQGRLAHTSGTLENAKSRELEDVAMAQALDAVAAEYIQAVQQADVAYQQAESQFQTMEQLRKQASDAVVQARTTIESATNYINQNTGAIRQESVDMLNRAIDTLPAWRDGSNASTLEATLHAAQQADEEASGAMDAAMSDVDEYNRAVQGQRTQDVLNAVLAIGAASLASGGRRRSRGGWGGGWGSGSSGGLGGGGGSTSGGWGGGGSSSGSWGGGGSSGGSWGGGGSSSGGW